MKRKEKAFVQAIIDNPKISNAQAVIDAGYNVKTRTTASVMGNEILKKPEVISALQNYVELTENAITNTIKDWKDSDKPQERAIAMQNAQYVHDKVFGKATQKVEQHTTGIKLTIDLTSALQTE